MANVMSDGNPGKSRRADGASVPHSRRMRFLADEPHSRSRRDTRALVRRLAAAERSLDRSAEALARAERMLARAEGRLAPNPVS